MPGRNSGRGRLCVVCTRSGTAALATVEEEQYWIIYNLTHKNPTQSNSIQYIEFRAKVLGRNERATMQSTAQILQYHDIEKILLKRKNYAMSL